MTYPNGGNSPSQPQLTEDNLAWHKDMVVHAVGQVTEAKDGEITDLKNSYIQAQREHTETKQRLAAAESLIEEFSTQIQDLQESGPADEELATRYAAAVDLLDEALKKLPELGSLRSRCETLEGLLEASMDRVIKERKTDAVQEHLDLIDPSYHETIRPVLENCNSRSEIEEAFNAYKAIASNNPVQNREPLPPRGGNSDALNESRKPTTTQQSADMSIAARMGRRLSLAVR